MFYIALISFFGIYLTLYIGGYFILSIPLKNIENEIVNIFHDKVSKIPALIEVMRPYVFDEKAFNLITELHSESMIRDHSTIYNLLEHNARIHDQFLFLLKLSVHIPDLQKDAYFLYVRDFIIAYDRLMLGKFSLFNSRVAVWNRFVHLKNITLI